MEGEQADKKVLSPSGGAAARAVALGTALHPQPGPFWSHRCIGRLVAEWWADGGGQSGAEGAASQPHS